MKTTKLHLIRHGLTQGNLDGIYMGGGIDQPLAPQGVEGILRMLDCYTYPRVGVVFSSPMQRALQTAELIYPHAGEKIILEDLRENQFGKFEGKGVAEVAEDDDFRRWLSPGSNYVPEGGESGQAFAARTLRAAQAMMDHLLRNGIWEAACVTHGGVIMSIMAQVALPRKGPREWMCANGFGFTLQTDAALWMRDGVAEAISTLPFDQ